MTEEGGDPPAELYLQDLNTSRERRLIRLPHAVILGVTFSVDGSYVYYSRFHPIFDDTNGIYRISVAGGKPEKVITSYRVSAPDVAPNGRPRFGRTRSCLRRSGRVSINVIPIAMANLFQAG